MIYLQTRYSSDREDSRSGCRKPCGDLSSLAFQERMDKATPPGDSRPSGRCDERVLWEPEKFKEAYQPGSSFIITYNTIPSYYKTRIRRTFDRHFLYMHAHERLIRAHFACSC